MESYTTRPVERLISYLPDWPGPDPCRSLALENGLNFRSSQKVSSSISMKNIKCQDSFELLFFLLVVTIKNRTRRPTAKYKVFGFGGPLNL